MGGIGESTQANQALYAIRDTFCPSGEQKLLCSATSIGVRDTLDQSQLGRLHRERDDHTLLIPSSQRNPFVMADSRRKQSALLKVRVVLELRIFIQGIKSADLFSIPDNDTFSSILLLRFDLDLILSEKGCAISLTITTGGETQLASAQGR
jgi:hypothetical protein